MFSFQTVSNRAAFATVAGAIFVIGLLMTKMFLDSTEEARAAADYNSARIEQISKHIGDLSLSLQRLTLKKIDAEDHSENKSKGKDKVEQRMDELRASLDRLWCKTQEIGSTGGFCLTEENIDVGGNHIWDLKLCQAIEELFGHSTVVDLGAGLGHYGKCFLRKRESIFITKEKRIAEKIHKEYLSRMGDFINKPQVIKSWDGYDGAINVGYLSNGFIKQQDLSVEDLWLGRTWDWVLSLEVGEHVPAPYEDILIDNLVRHSCKGLVISWGLENQPGHHHVNGKSNAYIKAKMADRGLVNDVKAEGLLRQVTIKEYFRNTLMVFRYPEGYHKC